MYSVHVNFRSMRSRWWFLALAACEDENIDNKTTGLHVEYELFMTNGEPSEILRYQFSDDEWRKNCFHIQTHIFHE